MLIFPLSGMKRCVALIVPKSRKFRDRNLNIAFVRKSQILILQRIVSA